MNDPNLTRKVETDPALQLFLDGVSDHAAFTLDPGGVLVHAGV